MKSLFIRSVAYFVILGITLGIMAKFGYASPEKDPGGPIVLVVLFGPAVLVTIGMGLLQRKNRNQKA